VDLPVMIPVRQHFPDARLDDVGAAMRAALAQLCPGARSGQRIAITAGSRGIANIAVLLRAVCAFVRGLGAEPLVVAAMGSHGGGSAAGQLSVLASLGITPDAVGAPVVGGVDVVDLGTTADGLTVYTDAFAASCDGILVINRVKPHTSFHGPLESGLVKMLVVGLGKPAGAAQFHRLGPGRLAGALESIGRVLLAKLPVLGGIAVLENGRDETADLVPVEPPDMISREQELLVRARELLPRLPVRDLDLLVVDEMGKNISGTGMDTNVIGRMGIRGVPDGEPEIRRIAVLDLSEGSHGNANGMGLADFITHRFRDKIDFRSTYLNTLTATFVERARMPIALESDRAVIQAALRTLGSPRVDEVRVIRIRNTLQLQQFWCSPAVLEEIGHLPSVEVSGQREGWSFDSHGNLVGRE